MSADKVRRISPVVGLRYANSADRLWSICRAKNFTVEIRRSADGHF